MKARAVFFGILATVALAVFGPAQAATEVNVYSARKEELIKPLLDRFTEKTAIKVNLLTGGADELLKRLQSEGRNSPADLFITVDAGRLHRAKAAGVLQPVSSQLLEQAVPPAYRDPENYWYGLSVRARPLMYARGRVDPAQLSTYEDLAHPKWKGRICIRSSSNIYNQSLVASMIAAQGEAKTEEWAKGLVANFARPPNGGDRDQIKAVAAGECDIAIANTYYLGGMLLGSQYGGNQAEYAAASKINVFWPNQGGRGVHVNVSGAGVTRSAQNRDNAVKLLEFLVNDASQAWYAEVNVEYPVKEGVAHSAILKKWGGFKADALNLARLGELNKDAVKLMDRAGWR